MSDGGLGGGTRKVPGGVWRGEGLKERFLMLPCRGEKLEEHLNFLWDFGIKDFEFLGMKVGQFGLKLL